ncbi:hypothetical protein JTB14_013564 [Gonioctena quinquepunctata]|nr:hypothetical protein JTB14_013564 [Gonioctena quinquepunctata]
MDSLVLEGVESWSPNILKELYYIRILITEEVNNRKIEPLDFSCAEMENLLHNDIDKMDSIQDYEMLFGNGLNHKDHSTILSIISEIHRKRLDKYLESMDYVSTKIDETDMDQIVKFVTSM